MQDKKVYKSKRTKSQRLLRLLASTFDPRAWMHLFKVVNYYNYTHVAELRQARLGQRLSISPTSSFANARNITIGDRVSIGAYTSLWAGSGTAQIVVGDDCMIAPSVMVTAANYRFNDGSPINAQAMEEADVVIGSDVWIGYGAVILPGVQIGDRAIIGAGAVVRQNVAENAIVAGNPGRAIGFRFAVADGDGPAPIALDAESDPHVLDLVRREFPQLDPARITGPLQDSGVDSFDLITLRTTLEAACGVQIADREWGGLHSLGQIAQLPSLRRGRAAVPAPTISLAPVAVTQATTDVSVQATGHSLRRYRLNMPQMALSGLSEAWLFKELGDIHWAMITDFLKSPSSAITDEAGDRLYATFTRIRLDAKPDLRTFSENDPLAISSRLERYGASFFFGHHDVVSDRAGCSATTMSTFAKYGERGANTSLIKGSPTIVTPGALPSLAEFPAYGVEYRARREVLPEGCLFECDYDILAGHDINGVGLLYFAAYPMIFDLCLERHEGKGFLIAHSTVSKDIFYFANSEPTDTLVFRLHVRAEDGDRIDHACSLSRKSDGKRMAEVVASKRRIAS